MVDEPNSKRKNYEDILPSDSELYRRVKVWSTLLEKYQSFDTSYDFNPEEMCTLFSGCGEENEESENYNISELEAIEVEEEDDGNNKNDSSPSFKKTLNETLKVIEKRKEVWENAGINNVMESFCLKEIEDKVGSWLQKHVKNNMNIMNNNNDDNITINSTNTLYNERQQHNSVELEQMLKNDRKKQLRKHYYYEVHKKNLDDDDDSSLESVDTAKYILSNRKPYKTKTNTMTIKRFRNIRDHHERERERDLFYRKLKSAPISVDKNHFKPIKSYSMYNYDDDSTSDESSFNEDHIRITRRTPYSVPKISRKRYIDDKKMKLRRYELQNANTTPHLKYDIASRRSLEENLKRKRRIKEKQLRDISYLASIRRTPSPQHSSSDVDNDLELDIIPATSLSLIQEEVHEKSNKKTGAFKTSFMREDKKNNDKKAKNYKIIKPTTSTSSKSILSTFEPRTSSTVISYNYKNDKNDFFNSKIISERNNSNEKNDNMHDNISKNSINSLFNNKNNSTTTAILIKSNMSNMTIIYSPQMDNSVSTSNSKLTISDGKIKLTKKLLENSIGEKNTEKILKNNKDKLLNYEINSDSKLIYLPSLHSDELSSDDDPIDYLFKTEKTHIVEITANGETNFILSI